ILRVVRRRLSQKMRARFDSGDFEQDVWASFFAMPPDQVNFRSPDDLAAYLRAVARNKVIETGRAQMMGPVGAMNRECSLDAMSPLSPALAEPGQATPSQVAIADEQLADLARGQMPAVRKMLALMRDGYSYDEIASRTGLHPKAIQRFVQELKKRMH